MDFTVPSRIGKESLTTKCMYKDSVGTYGAMECADFHCLLLDTGLNKCVHLDEFLPDRIARHKDTYVCLPKNNAGPGVNGVSRCADEV